MKTDVLGVAIDNLTQEEAIRQGCRLLEEDGFHYAVTPNPEIVLAAQKDAPFRAILNEADLALADGIGLIYAAQILKRPLKQKVTGIDFAQGLLAYLAENRHSLFLLGAKPGVAEKAAENLCRKYPGLVVCGVHDGYFQEDGPIVEAIRASQAEVLFVCLGAPKQERWMAKYGAETGVKLAVGLGGSLDVFAGTVERAPEKWQKANLEWLYRLFQEPQRLGRMAKLPWILVDAVRARWRKNP